MTSTINPAIASGADFDASLRAAFQILRLTIDHPDRYDAVDAAWIVRGGEHYNAPSTLPTDSYAAPIPGVNAGGMRQLVVAMVNGELLHTDPDSGNLTSTEAGRLAYDALRSD